MNMKLLAAAGFSALLLAGCASAVKTVKGSDFDPARHLKLAVVDFSGPDRDAAAAIPELMVTPLMDAGFEVIEREALKKISEEQKLNISGAVSLEDAIKIGRIAGVKAVLVGNFNSRKKESKSSVTVVRRNWLFRPGRAITYGRVSSDLIFTNLSVRIVDVESGEVVLSSVLKDPVNADDLPDAVQKIVESMKHSLGR